MSAAVSESEDPEPYSRGAPAARLWTPAFVDLLISEALFGFSYALFVLLPKLLAVSYGATASQIGAVMAAFGVASLVTIPLIAPIVKRLDCRRTMVLGTFLLGAAAFGFTFIHGAGALAAVLRGAQGIAWSLTFAAGMSLVADVAPPVRLGQGIGLYGAVALATSALGPAVAEPLATRFGARPLFVLSAVVALAGAWFCRRLPTGAAPESAAPVAGPKSGAARSRAVVIGVSRGREPGRGGGVHLRGALRAQPRHRRRARILHRVHAHRAGGAHRGHAPRRSAGPAQHGVRGRGRLRGGDDRDGDGGPEHLVPLGAAFGVVHGIVFPALMALVLGEAAREERPRLLAFANGAINLGITGLGAIGAIADHVGYAAVFAATGVLTTATAALLLVPAGRRARVSVSST